MRTLLPLALTIGISAIGFAQDNRCRCSNSGDVHTRMMNGKIVQENKHTINVITPAPGERTVTTYTTSYSNPDGDTSYSTTYTNPSSSTYVASYMDSPVTHGDVKVRTDRRGTVVETDKTTINKIQPAPSQYAMLSNGYVMSQSDHDVRVTTDRHGNIVQTDKTTINKIKPMPSSRSMTVVTTTDTTYTPNDYED